MYYCTTQINTYVLIIHIVEFQSRLKLIHMFRVISAMSELRVPQIVKILLEDDTLLQDWVVFAEILEAPSHRITSLRKQRNLSILTYHELLRELLLDWSSRLGKVATISLLVNLLKENHFVQSSGK